MAYKKTNYKLNKNNEGIVYKYANGKTAVLTYEIIHETDPTFTEEKFQKLKELSDEMYHEEAKSDWMYNKYIKASTDDDIDLEVMPTKSLEDDYFDRMDNSEKMKTISAVLRDKLTEPQRRRFLMHTIKKMTEREIAELEGVDRRAVHDSINSARKKLQKVLKNF